VSFDVSADAYLRFMGRYSEPLAVQFADLAGVQPGQRVLDVGSGPGALTAELVRRTGAEAVSAVEPSASFAAAVRERLPGVDVRRSAAEQLPFPDRSFDAMTFTYLLRYVQDPQATLTELARVVRPGGKVASLEFLRPPSLFWRFWWWLYTRLLLPAGGLLTGGREWFIVGRFLGPNISGHYRKYPVDWTVEAWRRAGFEDVGVKVMSLGGGLVMWGTRAGD